MKQAESELIADFWALFEKRHGKLALAKSADEPVYDELLECLQEIDPGLFLEFSSEPGNLQLIVTADGDADLFDLVDAIVLAAPKRTGWHFYPLKPKLGFPESIQWQDHKVAIADVVFDPLDGDEPEQLGLRLFVPNLSDDEREDAHNALLRALDHGLGEREFARFVQYTEVAALDADPQEYIALEDLESFIAWRRKEVGY